LQIILFHFFFFDVEGVLGPEFHLLFVDWDIVIKCLKQILFKAKSEEYSPRVYISNWCPFDYVNNCRQKWFRFRHLPYIFHLKPFIFITFSWSHSLSNFHEIWIGVYIVA
jgi:hypothetical protein